MPVFSNPPWSDKVIRSLWSRIEAQVGPALMPLPARLTKPQESIIRTVNSGLLLLASGLNTLPEDYLYKESAKWEKAGRSPNRSFQEYGCGHYGCVMPTGTPGTVFKITTDQSEANFVAAYLSLPKSQRPDGIVPYHRILAAAGTSVKRRPVYFIWRDEACHVGYFAIQNYYQKAASNREQREYYQRSLNTTTKNMGVCLQAAKAIRAKVKRSYKPLYLLASAQKRPDEVWQSDFPPRDLPGKIAWELNRFTRAAEDMMGEPTGAYIGKGLYDSLVHCGILLADVHLNNIGMPTGELLKEIGATPIITDPGHAVAMDNSYASVTIQEV